MICQNLVFVFYQIVSCLSTNREVNKHHNSHCLKTSTSDKPPSFWLLNQYRSILLLLHTREEQPSRLRRLQLSFKLSFDFQTIVFLTTEVRFPSKAHSFHCDQFSLICPLNLERPTTDKNHYLRSSTFFCRF